MAVVANARPLISLARIDQLVLLPALYGEVIVPPAVHQEVASDPQLPGARMLRDAPWLRVEPVDRRAVQGLLYRLDQGESEAIVLARTLGTALLIDERRGRAIATELGVRIAGTVGILIAAKMRGQIEAVMPLLDALHKAGVFISTRIYEEARRQAGEQ